MQIAGHIRDTDLSGCCVIGIGHFHAADNPGRKEPGTGELNYKKIFAEIDTLGYKQFVGLEYKPSKASAETVADVLALAE